MSELKTNYVESVFEDAVQKFYMTDNGDGTVSFSDIGDSQYIVKGDYITATDINTTNAAVNDLASRYSDWLSTYTPLDTNYTNDIFTVKKFVMTSLGNDEYTFTDQTSYTSRGTVYNAAKINATNSLLKALDTNYSSGMARILDYLHRQGATSDNVLTALTEMENYQQNTLGYQQGIQEVIEHPNDFDCYTQAQYEDLTIENSILRNNIQNVKNDIDSYIVDFRNNDSLYISLINSAKSVLNSIVAGISAAQAQEYVNIAVNSGYNVRLLEESTVVQCVNNIEMYKDMLG
jgi:hypothetical protein